MTKRRGTKALGMLAAALLTALTAVGAEAVADGSRPGSVLVFPKFVRGVDGDGVPASSFEVSVVCPPGASCSPTTPVRLMGLWICPGTPATVNPQLKQICQGTDFMLQTSANGTLWFNPENAPTALSPQSTPAPLPPNQAPFVPAPPCDRGMLVLWVIDASARAIPFNGLVGDAIVTENGGSSGYNAVAIQAIPPVGTVLAAPGAPLAFDDARYAALAGHIAAPLRYESGDAANTVETRLTLLVLTTWVNRPNHLARVDLTFHNENGRGINAGTTFVCWSEHRLTEINANLTTSFGGAGATKGLVRLRATATLLEEGLGINPPGPFSVPVLGLVETILRDPVSGAVRSSAYSVYQHGPTLAACLDPDSSCVP